MNGPISRLLNRRKRLREGDGGPALPVADAGLHLDQLDPRDRAIVEACLPYTMTGIARLAAIVDAVRYLVRHEVPGAFVECGVWRGGSVLTMIRTLQQAGASDRDIYLFDTFSGMTEPDERDTSPYHEAALDTWKRNDWERQRPWDEFLDLPGFDEASVRAVVASTGYPLERVHFVVGDILETVPEQAPERLAMLRLDTDWYASTRHEMEHLYPRLSPGGTLIIDDYGHWEGARQAVDEYFAARPMPLLQRIDYTGRLGVKG